MSKFETLKCVVAATLAEGELNRGEANARERYFAVKNAISKEECKSKGSIPIHRRKEIVKIASRIEPEGSRANQKCLKWQAIFLKAGLDKPDLFSSKKPSISNPVI